jgi:hypothetical protein
MKMLFASRSMFQETLEFKQIKLPISISITIINGNGLIILTKSQSLRLLAILCCTCCHYVTYLSNVIELLDT